MAPSKQLSLPQLSPFSIARTIWRRWWLIALVTIVIGSAGAYITKRLPNIYEASAIVLVDGQKIPEKFVSSTVQVSLQDSLSAIGQQVLSSGQLLNVIEELGLYAEDRKSMSREQIVFQMRQDLTINIERGIAGSRSGAFRITYQGYSPKVVAEVVNRVADLFVRENLRSRAERAEGTSGFLEEQLAEAKRVLDAQEAALSQYKLQHAGELPEQQVALLGALDRLEAELRANEEQTARDQQTKTMTENTLGFAQSSVSSLTRQLTEAQTPQQVVRTNAAKGDGTPATNNVPVTTNAGPLRSTAMRAELATLLEKYTEDWPAVKSLRRALDDQLAVEARAAAADQAERQRLNAEREKAAKDRPGTVATVVTETIAVPGAAIAQIAGDLNRERQRVGDLATQLDLLNRDLKARSQNRERILRDIASQQKHVEVLPVREQQMLALTRDYDNSRMTYRSLLEKKQSAEMSNDMERQQQSERFTIADPARPPSEPVKPRRMLYYGASLGGSFLLGLVLAFGLELKKNVFLGEWELPSHAPVLGRIGFMDGTAASGPIDAVVAERRA